MNPQPMKVSHIALGVILYLGLGGPLIAQPVSDVADDLSMYQEAMELFDREKYNPARRAFENYMESYPAGPQVAQAQYFAALSGLFLLHSDGERRIRDFIKAYPNHPKAGEALFQAGLVYYQNKDFKKAASVFSEVDGSLLDRDQNVERRFKLGFSLFTLRRFTEALEHFNALKRVSHEYKAASNYYAGYIAFEQGDLITAKQDLMTAETDVAYSAAVPYMLASIFYQEGDYAQVVSYGENVLLRPRILRRNDVLLLMGEAYFRLENYAAARPRLESYQEQLRSGAPPEVLYRLSYAQMVTGAPEKAVEGFKKLALQKDTLGHYASYYLGSLYAEQGNKQFALNSFRDASERTLKPNIAEDALFQSAKLEYETGNTSLAIETMQRFLSTYPSSEYRDDVNNLLSEAFLNSNNYGQAIKHIESLPTKSQQVRKVYQQVTFFKGTEAFNEGKYRKAVELFAKSIQYPLNTDLLIAAYFWSGEAYSIGRKYPQAINQYASIFRINRAMGSEYYLKSRYAIGYAYFNTKQYSKALGHFRYYTEEMDGANNPQYFEDALIRLGDCQYVLRQYGSALATYERAIRQDFSDRDYALYQKGVVLGIQDNVEEAVKAYDQLIRAYPRSRYLDDATFQRAELRFESEDWNRAITGFTEVISRLDDSPYVPFALLNRATAHRNLNQQNETAEDYIQLLTVYPSHSVAEDALFGLQDALTQLNRSAEFSQYLSVYRQANPDNTDLISVEYEAARNVYFNGEYARAVGIFQDFITNYSASSFASEARFLLAESYFKLTKYPDAIVICKQVVQENRVAGVNLAWQRLGQMYTLDQATEEAIGAYRQLARRAQNKRESYEAWNGLMESYYTLAVYDSVKHYATLILEKGGVEAGAINHANLLMGKSAFQEGRYGEALDHFQETAGNAKDINGAEAQYLIGEIHHQRKEYPTSLEVLFAMNQTFSQYDYWLGKAFLLIADNYLAMEEDFQAKATLESVIQYSPNEEIIAMAKQKLSSLKETVEGFNEEADSVNNQGDE